MPPHYVPRLPAIPWNPALPALKTKPVDLRINRLLLCIPQNRILLFPLWKNGIGHSRLNTRIETLHDIYCDFLLDLWRINVFFHLCGARSRSRGFTLSAENISPGTQTWTRESDRCWFAKRLYGVPLCRWNNPLETHAPRGWSSQNMNEKNTASHIVFCLCERFALCPFLTCFWQCIWNNLIIIAR